MVRVSCSRSVGRWPSTRPDEVRLLGAFLMVDSYGEFDPRTGGDPLPSPSEVGQFLYSEDGATWTVTRPMVNDDSFILFNDDDEMVTP